MSYSLHALKVHKTEYGTGIFNHNSEEFEELFYSELNENGNHEEYSDTYELDPTELANYITRLQLTPAETNEHLTKVTNGELANDLQVFLNEYDKTNNYIRLEWY